MLAFNVFAIFALASSVCATTLASQNTSAPSFVPLSPVGVVASVQLTSSPPPKTRLYYQDSNGNIHPARRRTRPLHHGPHHVPQPPRQRCRSALGNPYRCVCDRNGELRDPHLLPRPKPHPQRTSIRKFDRVGSQPRTAPPPVRAVSRTHAGFTAAADGRSEVLYAEQDPENGSSILRVGFVSTGAPGTLTEAVTTDLGATWVLAPLPA